MSQIENLTNGYQRTITEKSLGYRVYAMTKSEKTNEEKNNSQSQQKKRKKKDNRPFEEILHDEESKIYF